MLQFEELNLELSSYEDKLTDLAEALGLKAMAEEVKELEEQSAQDGFWDDVQNSQKIVQRTATLKNKIKAYDDLKAVFDDTLTLIDLANEEEDESLFDECRGSVDSFISQLDAMTLSTLLTGEYDSNNAILTFHAGAGGTEAQDWAQMLMRMYMRYAETHGYKCVVSNLLEGDDAGIKSCTLEIQGEFAKCNVYAHPECADCWAKLYCAGGCAANAYHATGDIAGVYEYGCDLFLIAYGMNDGGSAARTVARTMKYVLDGVRELDSDCSLMFVSTMVPNPNATHYRGLRSQEE